MEHEYKNARRNAENTLAEVNRHFAKGNIKDPKQHEMLTKMMENATRTLDNLDRLENKRPYSETNIGYGANTSRQNNAYNDTNDTNDMIRNTMDAINKILPLISDDFAADDNAEMRQGVPGTGPYANPRLRRRGGRKGIGTRRAEADTYDVDDNDMRSADHEQRMNNAVTRAAAEAAAATVRNMTTNPHSTNNIYPSIPVMPHNDAVARMVADTVRNMVTNPQSTNDDARYDIRQDIRNDARYDARNDTNDNYARSDDTTSDRANRIGPATR